LPNGSYSKLEHLHFNKQNDSNATTVMYDLHETKHVSKHHYKRTFKNKIVKRSAVLYNIRKPRCLLWGV